MTIPPRLEKLEREVLLRVPSLFPEGDSADLKIPGADREQISYAIQHLVGLGLLRASRHEDANPYAPYHLDVELTTAGEELRRDLARKPAARWWERNWKWFFPTAIAACMLGLSLLYHALGSAR